MPKFSYTVINPEGTTLNGVIGAENETDAREKLNKMDFSVVEVMPLSEIEEKAVAEEIIRYEFEGVDKNGRKVKGTIDATDKYAAFKRFAEEYHIEISALYKGAATEEEKETEKEKGILDLYTRLKKEQVEESSKKKILREITQERKYIDEQIGFITSKVDELLADFADILKPDEYNEIEKKRNKLLRLKTSANLPSLEHLCEELLDYIQNKEIYISQQTNNERVQKFNLEIKKALSEIQQGKLSKSTRVQILESIAKWQSSNIENIFSPSLINRFINKFLTLIAEWLEEDPRITDAKTRLRLTNQKIKDYKKIYKKEISEEYRQEMESSIKKLECDKEQLENEIKTLRKTIKEELEPIKRESAVSKIMNEFTSLTGYLLAFYFGFYIVSEYLFAKNFGIDPSEYIFSVHKSIQFHYIIAILFTANAVLSVKQIFLKKNLAGTILALPLILFLSALIIFNF